MALARTNRHQQLSGTAHGTGSFTTSSFTPANNTLLVAVVHAQSTANDTLAGSDLTISGGGWTWTGRIASTTHPGWGYGSRIFTAPVSTGASMTVAVDAGAFNIQQYRVEVYEYSDYDTGSPTGATAVGSDADGDAAASITLSGSPATTSEVISCAHVAMSAAGVTTITEGAGWTELFESSTSDYGVYQTQVRSGSTSTSVDWADLSAGGGGITAGAALIALEIKQSSGGGASSILRQMMMNH